MLIVLIVSEKLRMYLYKLSSLTNCVLFHKERARFVGVLFISTYEGQMSLFVQVMHKEACHIHILLFVFSHFMGNEK